jgi:hypothetical protein
MLVVFKLDDDMWKYAKKIIKGKEISAQCKKCPKIIKMSGGSRTPVLRHLMIQHGINIKQQSEIQVVDDVEPAANKFKTVADFLVPKQNLPEIVSEMAINGASIRFITRTKFIRDSVAARGFKLPANESGVMKLLLQDYDDKKALLSREIQLKKEENYKFSMTIDEYLSVRRRRYFSINLHGCPVDPDINLGKFEKGTRTDNLQKLYNALLTIKPTSTDVERVFSTTNWYCSKIRSRLSDKSLSALVFLKFYYKSHGTNV